MKSDHSSEEDEEMDQIGEIMLDDPDDKSSEYDCFNNAEMQKQCDFSKIIIPLNKEKTINAMTKVASE